MLRFALTLVSFAAVAASCALGFAGPVHAHYQPPSQPGAHTASNWIFDQSLYTNDPATGKRVEQYARPAAPRHDPDAIFDSPHGSYPFGPDPFGPYNYFYNQYPYGHHQNYGQRDFHPVKPQGN